MFNSLYRLKNQVAAESSNEKVFVGAAVEGKKGVVAISNVMNEPVAVVVDIKNFPTSEVQIYRIDEGNRYTLTGETLSSGIINLPACSCVEIKFWNI